MTELKKTYHFVEIYLFDNTLYVIPHAELPPIFVWCSVQPLIEVADLDSKNLTHAIESAKEASKSHFDPAHLDPNIKSLSGRKKEVHRIWNQGTKLWSLWWNEDGSIDMETLIPDKIYRGDMQWKIILKKSFNSSVPLEQIANEILNERVPTPDKKDLLELDDLVNTFGYKMSWLAIKNTNPEDIIQKLQMPDVQTIDWDKGIEKVYEYHGRPNNSIFLTPNVNGWVFIVGMYVCDFNKPDGKLDWLKDRMVELSNIFGEVQAFATHRVSEYHHWILARNGKIERCFAYGDGTRCNEGELTEAERQFPWDKLKTFQWFPDEEDVMTIAGLWSVNPQTIVETDVNGKTCYIANIPF